MLKEERLDAFVSSWLWPTWNSDRSRGRGVVETNFLSPGILELWSQRDQRRILRSITSMSSAKWRSLSEEWSEVGRTKKMHFEIVMLLNLLYVLFVCPRQRVKHEGVVNLAILGELVYHLHRCWPCCHSQRVTTSDDATTGWEMPRGYLSNKSQSLINLAYHRNPMFHLFHWDSVASSPVGPRV